MISDKKRLEVANIVYANVAGDFACFVNPKFQGPIFSWKNFAEMEKDRARDWMFIHHIGKKEEIMELAEQYAFEIAERLVTRSGFLCPDKVE